jgi:hypothetical protein
MFLFVSKILFSPFLSLLPEKRILSLYWNTHFLAGERERESHFFSPRDSPPVDKPIAKVQVVIITIFAPTSTGWGGQTQA